MIRTRLKPRPRALFLEGLESRAMLAVTATGAGGILRITGDALGNDVTVTAIEGEPGGFTVDGLTDRFGDPVAPRDFFNIRGITANLNGGNDTITIGDAGDPVELIGPVTINLGTGGDTANLFINTLGSVVVNGGSQSGNGDQDDEINVENSIIFSLLVTTYAGSDTLNIEDSAIFSLNANLGATRLTGQQTDSDTLFTQSSAIGTAIVSLGTTEVDEEAENEVDVNNTIFGSLTVLGGNRVDEVYLGAPAEECGIGDQLLDPFEGGLVDLVDDLEPLLEGILGRVPVTTILNSLDSILGSIAGPLGWDLNEFDFNVFFGDGDLSDALSNLLVEIGEELEDLDLTFCDIGAQTTLGILNINTGAGNDEVVVGQELFGPAAIPSLEELAFNALIADVLILHSATINTGDGHDDVIFNNVFIGGLLSVFLGAGNDELRLNFVTAAIASLNGGENRNDFDELFDNFNNNLGYLSYIKSFFEFDDEEGEEPEFPEFPV